MKLDEIKKLRGSDFDVLVKFLSMSVTTGEGVLAEFAKLKNAIRLGSGLSQFVYVPGTRDDRVVLVAHADTVWDSYMHYRDHETGMGADDRAGCAIVWLLKDTGHSLLILNGEESGMRGAKYLKNEHEHLFDKINRHRFMIEYDRRGSRDFKCYGVGTDEFRKYVAENMPGYTEPDRYSATDICELCERICGVNLSVGYTNEHTCNEELDIEDWANTLNMTRVWLKNKMPEFLLRRYVAQSMC